MNDMLVGILGLAVIAATVISLTRGKMLPAMAFILWPSVLALAMVAAGRCSLSDIEAMMMAGFGSTAALFVFSVLFFGIVCMGAMNLLPWSGASLRTATVLCMEGSSCGTRYCLYRFLRSCCPLDMLSWREHRKRPRVRVRRTV